MKLLFCLNLVFSFPLTILPTFDTIEALVLGKRETNTIEMEGADASYDLTENNDSQQDGASQQSAAQDNTSVAT